MILETSGEKGIFFFAIVLVFIVVCLFYVATIRKSFALDLGKNEG